MYFRRLSQHDIPSFRTFTVIDLMVLSYNVRRFRSRHEENELRRYILFFVVVRSHGQYCGSKLVTIAWKLIIVHYTVEFNSSGLNQ